MDLVSTKRKRSSSAKDCAETPQDLKFASFFSVVDPSVEAENPDPSLVCSEKTFLLKEIPTIFVNQFSSFLSNNLKLEASNGHIWDVCLESDDHSQCRMTTGWKEFACNMQVQSGDLIIFDLISSSHFKVYIYEGEDSCEKNILLKQDGSTQELELQKNSQALSLDNHNIVDCDKHNIIDCNQEDTIFVDDLVNHDDSETLVGVSFKQQSTENHSQKQNKNVPLETNIQVDVNGTKHITRGDLLNIMEQFHAQTQESFNKAIAYTSTNPFTVLVMNHSNVCHGFKLGFPRSFGKRYVSNDTTDVYLMDKDRRFWTVSWLGDPKEYCFSSGWKHFAKDHDLQCGDICVFELVKTKKKVISFVVHILKICPSDAELIKEYIPSKLSLVLERQ